jgi:LPS-assembly lipoprotein
LPGLAISFRTSLGLLARGASMLILAMVAAQMLAGCGFKLQTEAELPPEMVRTRLILGDSTSRFARRLSILLQQNGVEVVSGPEATAILQVPMDRARKEILSIGATARVREFRIVHDVSFRLQDASGTELVPLQRLQRSRVISFNEQDILAATREEEFLRDELADTLSREVLRRLARGVGASP